MKLKDIIRAEKANVDLGKWLAGHVPRSAFPMSRMKDKRYKYGPDYKWRLVKFEAAGAQCRVLILLNEGKAILRARLGVELNGDMAVLCDYEFHASEPGWHCHLTLLPADRVPSGAARRDKTKWPRIGSRRSFGATEASALAIVAARFRFQAQGELL